MAVRRKLVVKESHKLSEGEPLYLQDCKDVPSSEIAKLSTSFTAMKDAEPSKEQQKKDKKERATAPRYRAWFLTINNWTEEDKELFKDSK